MTRRLGIIARADDGGLGNQTRELVAHLDPEVVLVVLMGEQARGRDDLERFAGRNIVENPGPRLFDEAIEATLSQCDVLLTVEGPYHPQLWERCVWADVELVIQGNPELYRDWPCDRLLLPTPWRHDRLPGSEVLPMPVNCELLQPWARWDSVPTFVHLTGPAMLDRQGTQLVLDALPHVRNECFLWVRRDEPGLAQDRIGNVSVGWLPPADDYWQAIMPGAWALLQPRRYGGLSLCIQEAAAHGMPTLALDRDPESSFYAPVTLRAPVVCEDSYPMAGGHIGVADALPAQLAQLIDEFIEGMLPPLQPRAWALQHSWETLLPAYEEALR